MGKAKALNVLRQNSKGFRLLLDLLIAESFKMFSDINHPTILW
jgi:hypothetical protein